MQRLRNAIRKMAAIGTGVAFLGATLTSAVALDLADYPSPFVGDNGVFDESTAIVVGDNAAASDTLGAVDIATNLQFMAKTPVSSGAGTVTVSGGITEDIPIGLGIANTTTFAFDWAIDDSEISSFMDTQVQFQGADYDVHDELVMVTTSPTIETSLSSSDDDYESNVFMEIKKGALYYVLFFDDTINVSKASTDEPLEVNFLGKKLKIVDALFSDDGSGNKFKAYVGSEYFMDVGDVVTISGKKVTLNNVGSDGSVMVDVDGTIGVIPSSLTETVNGIEIRNSETFYEDTKAERAANLVIGEDAEATYINTDPYTGEDEFNPNWKWWIANLGKNLATSLDSNAPQQNVVNESANSGAVIGVYNYFREISSSDSPVGIGECYDLPNNYASVCMDSLTVADDDYLTLTFEYVQYPSLDESKHAGITEANTAIQISTPLDTALKIPANSLDGGAGNNDTKEHKTSTIWVTSDTSTAVDGFHIFYKDKDKNPQIQYGGSFIAKYNASGYETIALVNYKDTKDNNINISLKNHTAASAALLVDVNGDSAAELANDKDNIVMNWTYVAATGFTSLGETAASEEAKELEWGAGKIDIGAKDEDHRTIYGIVIKDPKSNGASDQVVLEIPADQVQANVVIKGSAATVAGGSTSYIPAAITIDTMLSSEVAGAESAHQLILVGGPCANPTVESVSSLGVTCSGWSLSAGEAILKLANNGNNVALLVAGTDAIDTRMAAKVVADYSRYDLKGTEQTVAGTLSSPTLK